MKKYIFISILLLLTNSSCEKDDVCLEPVTPKLMLKFYDFQNPLNEKEVENLSIVVLPENDTIYKNLTTNELSLQLNVNQDFSKFLFIKDQNTDTLTFSYERHPVFVSKTCGYKTIFEQFSTQLSTDNNLWIKNIEVITPTVNTDTLTHVKIFH